MEGERNKKALGEGTQSWGFHQMRIPEADFHKLVRINPDLVSKDAEIQQKALDELFNSELGRSYRIARSEHQVKRSNKNNIIIK